MCGEHNTGLRLLARKTFWGGQVTLKANKVCPLHSSIFKDLVISAIYNLPNALECIENLATRTGSFRYRNGADSVYVCHEAHVFAGLVDLLVLTKQASGKLSLSPDQT